MTFLKPNERPDVSVFATWGSKKKVYTVDFDNSPYICSHLEDTRPALADLCSRN